MSRGPGDSIEKLLELSARKAEADRAAETKPSSRTVNNSNSDRRPRDGDRSRGYDRSREDGRLRDDDRPRDDGRLRDDDRYRRRRTDENENRYSTDREENDQRRSRRTRDLVTEDDVEGGSDSDSANESSRHRDSHHHDHHRSDPDRKYRDREDRHFKTARDYSDRHHDTDRDHSDRRYGRSRAPTSDDRYRPTGGREGPSRRPMDRRSRSPRPTDRRRGSGDRRNGLGSPHEEQTVDLDKRTVFVQQLAMRCREKDLKRFFAQCGEVISANLVTDRGGRSKGIAYVEFDSPAAAEKALALTGQKVVGQPIIVQNSEADKNLQARTTAPGNANMPFHRLHIGNINFAVPDDDLRQLFETWGEIELFEIQKQEDGRSKGHGYVQYKEPESARRALEGANNMEIGGRNLRLGLGHDSRSGESTEALLAKFGTQQRAAEAMAPSHSAGSNERGGYGYGGDRGRNDKAGGASALDDNEVAGVAMSNHHRNDLMRKLARMEDSPEEKQARSFHRGPATSAEVIPTRCILLKNMYDSLGDNIQNASEQAAVRELTWDECEEKYGKVVHLDLALDRPNGQIYLKFESLDGSKKAMQSLNGRWFDERIVTASYVADQFYHARYPAAATM